MKKPEIRILPETKGSRIYYVMINGGHKYRCISKEHAEAIEEMIDTLIESLGHMEGYLEYREIVNKIKQVLKKAGVEL